MPLTMANPGECYTIRKVGGKEETRRFQTRESIGTCPVCGSLVYESKTNFYCSNHDCHFALWKDNRYLQSMEKTMDKKMAAELLKSGCVYVKDLYSRKKDTPIAVIKIAILGALRIGL